MCMEMDVLIQGTHIGLVMELRTIDGTGLETIALSRRLERIFVRAAHGCCRRGRTAMECNLCGGQGLRGALQRIKGPLHALPGSPRWIMLTLLVRCPTQLQPRDFSSCPEGLRLLMACAVLLSADLSLRSKGSVVGTAMLVLQ